MGGGERLSETQFDIRISVLNELAFVVGAKILVMQYLKIRKRHNLLCVLLFFDFIFLNMSHLYEYFFMRSV